MRSPLALPALYAILDVDRLQARHLDPHDVLDAWLDAGVRLVQLRAKSLASGAFLALAEELVGKIHSAGATFIVNDRADIARLCDADGVHVGQDDLSPTEARLVVGERALVGLSTHTESRVRAAVEEPIDYLAIGPVFDTHSKERPDPVVGLAGVKLARALAAAKGIPVVAIGGITIERAPEVLAAGAQSVAAIADLLQGDPGNRAREYLRALTSGL